MEPTRVTCVLFFLAALQLCSAQNNPRSGVFCTSTNCFLYDTLNTGSNVVGHTSWQSAQASCARNNGLSLAVFPNVEAMASVQRRLGLFDTVWVGLREQPGLRWMSGFPVSTNRRLNPGIGASSTQTQRLPSTTCAYVQTVDTRQSLNFGVCSAVANFACEDRVSRNAPCSTSEITLGNRCVSIFLNTFLSWYDAAQTCGRRQRNLLTLQSEDEMNQFAALVRSNPQALASGGRIWTGLSGLNPVWGTNGQQPGVFNLPWNDDFTRLVNPACMVLTQAGLRRYPCDLNSPASQGFDPNFGMAFSSNLISNIRPTALCSQELQEANAAAVVARNASFWTPYVIPLVILGVICIVLLIVVCVVCSKLRKKKESSYRDFMKNGHSPPTVTVVGKDGGIGSSTSGNMSAGASSSKAGVSGTITKPDRPNMKPNYDNPPNVEDFAL